MEVEQSILAPWKRRKIFAVRGEGLLECSNLWQGRAKGECSWAQGGLLYNVVEERNADLPCDDVRADVFMPGGASKLGNWLLGRWRAPQGPLNSQHRWRKGAVSALVRHGTGLEGDAAQEFF